MWVVGAGALLTGFVTWGTDTLQGGVIAMWSFVIAGVALALVLPLPYALSAPLFVGVAGWTVNMMPFVLLVSWFAVVARWTWGVLRAKRWPEGGRWVRLPIAMVVWTAAGVVVIGKADLKHFALLLGIQVLISGSLLMVVDALRDLESRARASAGLVSFVIVLSVGVLLQWVGVPIQPLQHDEVRARVEEAYGVDAFPNNIGMIKYARSVKPGITELDAALKDLRAENPDIPPFKVFRPKFQAFENSLVVQFNGSARPYEKELAKADVTLIYDDVGLGPARTVPRLRSFPRNALTYAGVAAAMLPLAFFLWWSGDRRRRLLGQVGVAACLFGVGFSLARGAWAAVGIGLLYLLVDRAVNKRQRLQFLAACIVGAIVLTGVFLIKYDVDPLSGRAGGGASVSTRDDLYKDTLNFLNGKYILFGYGTEQPRTESGTVHEGEGQRYVPRAGTHSTYLNYLFRLGIPGFVMIVMLFFGVGLHARAASREKEGDERTFAACLATSVAIAGAHAVILSLYVEPIYTLMISTMLGLAMASAVGLRRSVRPWRKATSA